MQEGDPDDYDALERINAWIKYLTPLVKPKDSDEEAKTSFLWESVTGTLRELWASLKSDERASHQEYIKALKISQREIARHDEKCETESGNASIGTCRQTCSQPAENGVKNSRDTLSAGRPDTEETVSTSTEEAPPPTAKTAEKT